MAESFGHWDDDYDDDEESCFAEPLTDILSLRKGEPEYRFWKEFFPMANARWNAQFERRTSGSGKKFWYIYWDFMDGVTASKKGEQYQQALDVTKKLITDSEILTKVHLGILLDCATAVLRFREEDQKRYPVKPNDPIWKIHNDIIKLWRDLVAAITAKANDKK